MCINRYKILAQKSNKNIAFKNHISIQHCMSIKQIITHQVFSSYIHLKYLFINHANRIKLLITSILTRSYHYYQQSIIINNKDFKIKK